MNATSLTASFKASSLGAELHMAAAGTAHDLDSFGSHEFWPQFVPEAVVGPDQPRKYPDLSITIEPAADWKFDADSRQLTCPPANLLHAVCTAGYMLEAQRQRMGMYTLHGNVISKEDRTVALLGSISGIGKTGLSSYAADMGWRWLSDEKFVMNEAGECVGSVSGVLQDEKTERSARGNVPDAAGLRGRKISAFVIPIVTTGGDLVSHTYEPAKSFWHVRDEISRDIRTTPFDLDGPDVPLPSFDSEALATKRHKVATHLSNMIPFHQVMGEEAAVLNYLSEL